MGSSSRFDPLPPDKSSAGTGADMRAQPPFQRAVLTASKRLAHAVIPDL